MEAPAHNLTVLFADVTGSTRLYETLGDSEALQTIGRCLDIIRLTSESHGGRVIKTIGDGSMTTFPIRQTPRTRRSRCTRRSRSSGPAKAGRFPFTPAFTMARSSAGKPTSSATPSTSPRACRSSPRPARRWFPRNGRGAVAGAAGAHPRAGHADRQGQAGGHGALRAALAGLGGGAHDDVDAAKARPAYLRLNHGGRSLVLDESRRARHRARCGKRPGRRGSDGVAAACAHRAPAREIRAGRRESNGTYCTVDDEPEVLLLREEWSCADAGASASGNRPPRTRRLPRVRLSRLSHAAPAESPTIAERAAPAWPGLEAERLFGLPTRKIVVGSPTAAQRLAGAPPEALAREPRWVTANCRRAGSRPPAWMRASCRSLSSTTRA